MHWMGLSYTGYFTKENNVNTPNEPDKMPREIWANQFPTNTYHLNSGTYHSRGAIRTRYIHSSREAELLACIRDLAGAIDQVSYPAVTGSLRTACKKHASIIEQAKAAGAE